MLIISVPGNVLLSMGLCFPFVGHLRLPGMARVLCWNCVPSSCSVVGESVASRMSAEDAFQDSSLPLGTIASRGYAMVFPGITVVNRHPSS